MLSKAQGRIGRSTDSGIGMVEVLVTVVIASVLGTMVTLFLLTTFDATREADGRNGQAAAARTTLESWSLLLRLAVSPALSTLPNSTAPGADRIYSVEPESIRFCAALGTKGDSVAAKSPAIGVRLALESNKLVEYRWLAKKADGTAQDGCAAMRLNNLTDYQQKRILVQNAELVPGRWLFTPFPFDQPELNEDAPISMGLLTSTLIRGPGPMGVDDRLSIVGVQLAFRTTSDPFHPAPASTYTTTTALTVGS